jgi:hypothetical protein
MNFIDTFGLYTVPFNKYGEFGKPIPGGDDKTDTYVKVTNKEFENNKIDYNKKGELRGRHKNMQIDKSFRESQKVNGSNFKYQMEGYQESKDIFEFCAGNTIVEWAQNIYQNKSTGDVLCEILTNHDETSVAPNASYKKGGYTLVDMRHSHPSGFISPDDRSTNYYYNMDGPVVSFMYKYGKYYPYSNYRSNDEKYAVEPPSYKK